MNVGLPDIVRLVIHADGSSDIVKYEDALVCVLHILKHKSQTVDRCVDILKCTPAFSNGIINILDCPQRECFDDCLKQTLVRPGLIR